MTDPSTDRERLVEHAYKDSRPLLARGSIYHYQRDPVAIHPWVLGQVDWPDTARALDVGCGPGFYLATLRGTPPSAHHVGVDLSLGMAAEAGSVADVLVGDAQRLPFVDASFDVLIAAHMLYHVPDADAAVFEFARVLAPGGHALVVLNGRAHMHAIRELLRLSLRDLDVNDSALPTRSAERITIETAGPMLSQAFDVLRCERVERVVEVPVAQPVIDYADSTEHFYAPFLPPGVAWPHLMERVTARVDATIATKGAWRARSHVGCFVCRPR